MILAMNSGPSGCSLTVMDSALWAWENGLGSGFAPASPRLDDSPSGSARALRRRPAVGRTVAKRRETSAALGES